MHLEEAPELEEEVGSVCDHLERLEKEHFSNTFVQTFQFQLSIITISKCGASAKKERCSPANVWGHFSRDCPDSVRFKPAAKSAALIARGDETAHNQRDLHPWFHSRPCSRGIRSPNNVL